MEINRCKGINTGWVEITSFLITDYFCCIKETLAKNGNLVVNTFIPRPLLLKLFVVCSYQ